MTTARLDPSHHRPTAPDTVVSVADLRVRLKRQEVLRGVDLDFGRGVHGLLGPNGAGKSTLIRVLASTLRHDGGEVSVLGRSYARATDVRWVRGRLGYLPQSFGFHRSFTAREYVEHLAWLKKVPTADIPAAADRALERVDLVGRAETRMGRLSGGMLRRVGVAQAIVNAPDVLLLDEPTVGLDPEQRVGFRQLMREVATDACVIVSTHLVEDVAHACDTVTVLVDGSVTHRTDPAGLVALGSGKDADDLTGASDIERGYTAAVRSVRTSPEETS